VRYIECGVDRANNPALMHEVASRKSRHGIDIKRYGFCAIALGEAFGQNGKWRNARRVARCEHLAIAARDYRLDWRKARVGSL